MTRSLRLIAPAKINWSLEVLRLRPDGYHEIRSVLQTISLHDIVTLTPANEITLEVSGPSAEALRYEDVTANLAYRAAVALRDRASARRGVRIVLEKHVPVAAGLGGGSSDAAAVLRGLNDLWELGQPEQNLIEIAGEIGSDPPFFIVGGTAAVRGRGDVVEPLADAVAPSLLLVTPPPGQRAEKTARMFAALRPDDFTDGDVSVGVREAIVSSRALVEAELANVFERVVPAEQPQTAHVMSALTSDGLAPHLAGAGPTLFLLQNGETDVAAVERRINALGFEAKRVRTLSRAAALHIERI